MHYPMITTPSVEHRDRVMQTITLGFSSDPVARWIWPEANVYQRYMPKFAQAFAGKALENGTAYIANNFNAAALWLAPGIMPNDQTIESILAESVRPEIASDVEPFFAQMDDFHPSDRPCWYLPMIAADPVYTGRGLGAALMAHAVRRCDKEGIPAYLESSNPRNISLYQRHGFEVIGEIQAGSSPPMFPMIREPQKPLEKPWRAG